MSGPVLAAAQIITALQTVTSRGVSPVDSLVVGLYSTQTSRLGAFNVPPEFDDAAIPLAAGHLAALVERAQPLAK